MTSNRFCLLSLAATQSGIGEGFQDQSLALDYQHLPDVLRIRLKLNMGWTSKLRILECRSPTYSLAIWTGQNGKGWSGKVPHWHNYNGVVSWSIYTTMLNASRTKGLIWKSPWLTQLQAGVVSLCLERKGSSGKVPHSQFLSLLVPTEPLSPNFRV